MKIIKVIPLKEIARIRDKLIKMLEKEKEKGLAEQEHLCYEGLDDFNETQLQWFIKEIQEAFDLEGEEDG